MSPRDRAVRRVVFAVASFATTAAWVFGLWSAAVECFVLVVLIGAFILWDGLGDIRR